MAQLSSCIHLFNKFVTHSKFCKTLQWSHYPLCTKIAVVRYIKFRLFQFRSPLLSESFIYFLFVLLLRCFSSQAFLLIDYVFIYGFQGFTLRGFPHSETHASIGVIPLHVAYRSISRPSSADST